MRMKLLFVAVLAFVFVSCQFNETMVLNADGSGSMEIEVDLSQMMSIAQSMDGDAEKVKMDTIVKVKDFLEAKKDSIATLPADEQKRLKDLENFEIRVHADSEKEITKYTVINRFKNLDELENIMDALSEMENIVPTDSADDKSDEEDKEPSNVGVRYSYANNVFVRDAYIKDLELHKQQTDSLQMAEGFLAASLYSVNYTFPKKVKKVSNSDAKISNGDKTVMVQVPFLDYFKNPDVLDLEVTLED